MSDDRLEEIKKSLEYVISIYMPDTKWLIAEVERLRSKERKWLEDFRIINDGTVKHLDEIESLTKERDDLRELKEEWRDFAYLAVNNEAGQIIKKLEAENATLKANFDCVCMQRNELDQKLAEKARLDAEGELLEIAIHPFEGNPSHDWQTCLTCGFEKHHKTHPRP